MGVFMSLVSSVVIIYYKKVVAMVKHKGYTTKNLCFIVSQYLYLFI